MRFRRTANKQNDLSPACYAAGPWISTTGGPIRCLPLERSVGSTGSPEDVLRHWRGHRREFAHKPYEQVIDGDDPGNVRLFEHRKPAHAGSAQDGERIKKVIGALNGDRRSGHDISDVVIWRESFGDAPHRNIPVCHDAGELVPVEHKKRADPMDLHETSGFSHCALLRHRDWRLAKTLPYQHDHISLSNSVCRTFVSGGVGDRQLRDNTLEQTATLEQRPSEGRIVRVGNLRAQVAERRTQDGGELLGGVPPQMQVLLW